MLKRMPSPDEAAHSGSASQNQVTPANTTWIAPININEVIASAVKLKRFRSRPARSPVTTTPALPAANIAPTPRGPTSSRSCANSTSCVNVVAPTKLISAIINEMLRSTGCPMT